MALTSIEIIALIFSIFALIKITVVLVNKKIWLNKVAKPIYQNSSSSFIFTIIAIIIFYFLIKKLSIVQIFAVMAFTSILIALAFLQFNKETIQFIQKAYVKKLRMRQIIYILIWLALILWVLRTILIK